MKVGGLGKAQDADPLSTLYLTWTRCSVAFLSKGRPAMTAQNRRAVASFWQAGPSGARPAVPICPRFETTLLASSWRARHAPRRAGGRFARESLTPSPFRRSAWPARRCTHWCTMPVEMRHSVSPILCIVHTTGPDAGACLIWHHRNPACATWFCRLDNAVTITAGMCFSTYSGRDHLRLKVASVAALAACAARSPIAAVLEAGISPSECRRALTGASCSRPNE